jgi:hypothetical protein
VAGESVTDIKERRPMIRQSQIPLILFVVLLFLLSDASFAAEPQQSQPGIEFRPTYGHYWQSQKWGWYGAKRVVRTPVEAKEIIERFFYPSHSIRVIKIRERAHFFVAELLDQKGMVVDLILIDKRTGRIRSMF